MKKIYDSHSLSLGELEGWCKNHHIKITENQYEVFLSEIIE